MAVDPSEQFNIPIPEKVETFDGRSPLPIGEGALRSVMDEKHEILGGRTLFEAAFQPDDVDPNELAIAIEAMVEQACAAGKLHQIEAESLVARLYGLDTSELADVLPDEYAKGKNSTQNHLVALVRNHPGELHAQSGDKGRHHHALAMKNLMLKFVRDNMSLEDIEDWVGSITDPKNNYYHVQPHHVLVMIAGTLDAVFRRAPDPVFKR